MLRYRVNWITNRADKFNMKSDTEQLPKMIGLKTKGLEAEIRKWRRVNKRVPWAQFIRDAIDIAYERPGRKAA